jgi:diguanylate cyclase (GGDEF)-like protein
MLLTVAVIAGAMVVQQLTGLRIVVVTYFLAPAITALLGAHQGFGSLAITLATLSAFFFVPDRLPDYIPDHDVRNVLAMVGALALGLIGVVTTLAIYRTRLERLLTRIHREARVDTLTGASNRRHGNELLASELERARRLHHPLSVILFDIDHFKSVNDGFGHLTGDRVLEQVAELARTDLRSYDTLVRWGGEEFLILLPESTTTDAVRIAERLRLRITEHAFIHGQPLTISAGVAGLVEQDDSESLVARADALLYRIKGSGRNRIMGSPEGVTAALPAHRLN